jgi:hypothetical protein
MLNMNALNILWIYTGRGISYVRNHLPRFPQSVRYATVCNRQLAGQAQSGSTGYQTHVITEQNWVEEVYQQEGDEKRETTL